MGAREGLEHVVMRVDETRDHNVARSVEHAVHASRRFSASSNELDDAAVIHHNAATGAFCKDCDRVLNPHSHGQAPRDLSEKVTSVGLRLTSLHRRRGAAWLLPQRTVAVPLHADIGFSCGAATSVIARLE